MPIEPVNENDRLINEQKSEKTYGNKPPQSLEIQKVGFLSSALDVSRFSLPFAISRSAVAANVLINGSVTPKIGSNAAAAGPTMISVVYAVLGPGRSILLATGILIGKKNGEVNALLKEGKTAEATQIQESIGNQLRQSMVFGTLLALPSMGFMVAMGPILQLTGMNPAVVKEVEGFLNSTATGLLPMFWSTSDQQFAMGTGHKYIPMVFGTLFPLLAMGIGYPLALGWINGIPKLGTAGLGYGMSAAAWLSFLGLRAYFLKSEFTPYKIYKLQARGLFEQFSELLKLGLPLGFQALTEWGNMFVLSSLVGRKGSNSLMAANGSFQIITAVTLVSAALGQGISIKIAEQLGKMRIFQELGKINAVQIINQNIKTIGNAGISVGALVSIALMVPLVTMPKQIQSIFLNSEDPDYEKIMIMAQSMLIINAIGLIFDTVRNLSASALGGSKDVMFAPIMGLLNMSLIALSAGALLTEYWDLDANSLFITRDVGILMAAIAVTMRWLIKNHMPQDTAKQSVIEDKKNSGCTSVVRKVGQMFCFFKEEKDTTNSNVLNTNNTPPI